jgi:hypothetical protein
MALPPSSSPCVPGAIVAPVGTCRMNTSPYRIPGGPKPQPPHDRTGGLFVLVVVFLVLFFLAHLKTAHP